MTTSLREQTVIKYDATTYDKVGEIYMPSGDERDKFDKMKEKRTTNMTNKPKNMYRWGEVESSHMLDKGTKVYYSQYDSTDYEYKGQMYNIVLNEHLLAYEH